MASRKNTSKTYVDSIIWMNLLFVGLVLCLHSVNYTKDYLWEITHRFINPYEAGIDQILQKLAVGGFLFLSGYKLALSKKLEPTKAFLIGRLLRIYPLYFLAVIASTFTAYPYAFDLLPNSGNFVMHILALQSWLPNFFQANYLTIWFVSNLFFCYALFPILRIPTKRSRLLLMLSLLTAGIYLARFACLALFRVDFFPGDFDIYFLFFGFGMAFSVSSQQDHKSFSNTKLAILVATLVASMIAFIGLNLYLPKDAPTFFVLKRTVVFGFTLPAFIVMFSQLSKVGISKQQAYLLKYLNTASFCVFLFHRPIWAVMSTLWNNPSYLQSVFILGVGIPFIFVVSYQLQFFYASRVFPYLKQIRSAK